MEIQIITLLIALIALIISVIILTKVNRLLFMLRSPIVKKLSPDLKLKSASRHLLSAQEMAIRDEQNNRKQHSNKSNAGRVRSERPKSANRNEKRSNKPERSSRREKPMHSSSKTEKNEESSSRSDFSRRPLAPRTQNEAPVASENPAPKPSSQITSAETVAQEFSPSKVRYGRRNVVKKVPELADED
ncbi:MAG: hypothetical protein GX116_07165 [Fibrobacter sp.]|nr:hypothetical protein [Fibrobacter sp.]